MVEEVFARANSQRVQLTNEQIKSISNSYKVLAKNIEKEIAGLKGRTNVSSILRIKYLEDLKKKIKSELEAMAKAQEESIKSAMSSTADAVVEDARKQAEKLLGIEVSSGWSYIPKDIVEDITSGKLYEGRWSLSSAIWSQNKKALDDINSIVASGIAAQKSTYDIAKDLQKYVDPSQKKDWSWSKVYPNTAKRIDYNAQRLARTMITHSYQESTVRATQDNPFIIGYRWLTSNHETTCQICKDRATDTHGVVSKGSELHGVFPKDALPLDHPNGQCTISSVMEDDLEEIGKQLADWVNGKSNKALDDYYAKATE